MRISGCISTRIVNYGCVARAFFASNLTALWRWNLAELSGSLHVSRRRSLIFVESCECPWTLCPAAFINSQCKNWRLQQCTLAAETWSEQTISISRPDRTDDVDPLFFAANLIKVEVDNLVAMWAHVPTWIEKREAIYPVGCRYRVQELQRLFRTKEQKRRDRSKENYTMKSFRSV